MSAYPDGRAARDRFVLAHRPPRIAADPWAPPRLVVERERSTDGTVANVATLFLTGRECPWHCVMCDLWRHTTEGDTPAGAIAAQVRTALSGQTADNGRAFSVAKLYNAGSFFDPRAVPESDYDDIATSLAGFSRVVVESHPLLIGSRTSHFARMLSTRSSGAPPPALEVAIGLETAHPEALERLNKHMTLEAFSRGADWLRRSGMDLRVFLLVSPPFIHPSDQDTWLVRSVDAALAAGATAISLIPTRSGNGALDALAADGLFHVPRLRDLERSLNLALSIAGQRGTRVFADLWDLERFADCPSCFDARRERLHDANLTQQLARPCACDDCGPVAAA